MNKTIRILHLEDEEPFERLIKQLLLKENIECKIDRVETLEDFKSAFLKTEYDLVLADYALNDYTGLDAFVVFRELGLKIPFILFSGHIGEEKAIESLRMGVTDYVMKQNVKALAPAIIRALNEAEEIRQVEQAEKIRHVLFNIASAGNEIQDPFEYCHVIQRELGNILDTTNFFIGMYDAMNDILTSPFMKDENDKFRQVPAKNTISARVIRRNKSLLLSEKELKRFFDENNLERVGSLAKCWLGVPLRVNGEVIGIIAVQSYKDSQAFKEEDKELLEFVASQISASIKNKLATKEILKLSRSIEQSPVSVVITDLKGNIEYVNPRFCEITGYTCEEAIGKNPRILKSGETPASEYKQLWDHITKGKTWHGKFHNKKKNGELFWEEATIGVIKDDEGKIVNYIAFKEDITRRVEAEQKYRLLNKQNEQLLKSIASILIVMDEDEHVMRWNPKAAEIFGIPADEAIDKHILETGITWDWTAITQAIMKCRVKKQSVYLTDIVYKKNDGKDGFLNLHINPFAGETDLKSGFLIFGEEVTERKTLESQLAQAQKLESIGQLAAGIAHEINTPTQYVGDNIYFMKDAFKDLNRLFTLLMDSTENSDPADILKKLKLMADEIELDYLMEEIPQAIEQAMDGVQRVTKIVRAMKEFSHPGIEEKTPVDLNKNIENTLTVARNEYKYVADLETDLDENIGLVPCLPGELNQVILNMVVNAAHAIADVRKTDPDFRGLIRVSSKLAGDWAEIKISDNGPGVPEKIRDKIFDPFFTTKEVGKGTGQGLAISHNVVVKKHGGKILMETEEGKGTTFIIRIPIIPVEKGEELPV